MRTHGPASVWRTPIGVVRANDDQGWYQQLKAWWAAHKTVRHDTKLTALNARWDARREVVTPLRADAAADMGASPQAGLPMTALDALV